MDSEAINMKEVYFYEYCKKCKHKDKQEDSQPCAECLKVGAREFSHKPLKYEEATE